MNHYSVYIHIVPNGKKYIGLTKNSPSWRWRNGRGYSRSVFGRAVKRYGWENIKHGIFAQGLTLDEAEAMEVSLIDFYKTTNPKYGYNISLGGHVSLSNPSPEFKEKLRAATTGANNWRSIPIECVENGEVYESIHIAAKRLNLKSTGIRRVLTGRNKHTGGYSFRYHRKADEREKIKTLSKEDKANLFKKAVAVYSSDGAFIAIYNSRKEAANACGTTLMSVSNCIHGYKNMSKGFYFRDASGENYEKRIIPHPGSAGANNPASRSISCFTKDGIFVKSYQYATMAANEVNADLSSIIKCCRGKIKSCKGFIWRYNDEK